MITLTQYLAFLICLILELMIPFSTNPIRGTRNFYNILKSGKTWSSLLLDSPPHKNYSKQWLSLSNPRATVVAHALGQYSMKNTLDGALMSLQQGIKLMEVDIFKDASGRLRCHHGPENPPPYQDGDCDLGSLIRITPNGTYLIIDIKTDFETTANSILDLLSHSQYYERRGSVVFQLYKPSHVKWFLDNSLGSKDLLLNAPIVTLYRTYADPSLVSATIPKSFGAITYPMNRMTNGSIERLILPRITFAEFVHPAPNCKEVNRARKHNIYGFYGPSEIHKC